MKRLLLTLCCTLATSLFALTWTDPETNITWTYTLSNGTVSLGGGWGAPAIPTSYAGDLTIPATMDGYPVAGLNSYAFYGCSLTSVVIPEGVTAIGDDAFARCSSLTSVVIPEGVTSIGDYAFYYCSSLTSVVIPEGVTSIGSWAFSDCSSLTSVVIPEGVTSIGSYAFQNCSSLTSVVIPEGVTSIGSWAFDGCSFLTSVVIPEGVTSIGSEAFRGCSSLTSVVIPEGVTSIGYYAFRDCSSLTSVVIPSSVTSIETYTFSGCTSLTSVVIPEGVTFIGGSAFSGCSSMTSFSLPASVTSMPEDALPPSSNNLKVLEVAPRNPLYSTENNILYSKGKTKILCVARGGIVGSLTLPSTLTSIPEYAFFGCSSLTSVVIPVGVTSIGSWSFSGCSSLTSVVIPVGVTSIGSEAFRDCSSLTSVVIPEGVTSIGSRTFAWCSSLTSVVIPEGVTSIGDSAFSGCTSLTSLVIPEGVTAIGDRAFSDCARLKEVTFLGDVPEGWGNVYPSGKKIYFSQAYAGKWNAVLSAAQRGTMVELISKAGVTVTAEMTTPKTMRVTYSVASDQPTVKVRAVAWKDGVRSFANIVLVKTAAEGSPEAVPNGGEVTTGVEHTFVWQVSDDWATDLDKVAMEILVEEGTLLPQEKITIPALNDHPEMTITRNRLASWQLFDALVWCYAEGDEALVATDGVVKVNGTAIANGARLPDAGDWDGGYSWSTAWKANATTLLNYLYGKMGYKVLAGEDLAWARAATRLELADSGLDQVSVKITEE